MKKANKNHPNQKHSMMITLTGSPEKTQELHNRVCIALEDLGLSSAVDIRICGDISFQEELQITQDPALCIEEDSIDFKEMIFEGVVPELEELHSLFLSVFGISESSCGCHDNGCGSCSIGCGHAS